MTIGPVICPAIGLSIIGSFNEESYRTIDYRTKESNYRAIDYWNQEKTIDA
jgi:hypothetical protein